MSYPIKNMYVEVLDPKYLDKPREFEHQKQINLNLLTSFIAVGSTGSFKTNSVLQIILAYGDVWDSFTLCARTTDEPLYRWFTDYMQKQLRLGKSNGASSVMIYRNCPRSMRPKVRRTRLTLTGQKNHSTIV